MRFKLGIAPINWSNDDDPNLGGDISFEQCINEMVATGYKGTELGNKFPRDPLFLKKIFDEINLELTSAWFSTYFTESEGYQSTLTRFMEHLSFLRAMGARFVNVCECGHSVQNTEKDVLKDKPQFNKNQWSHLIHGLHALGRIANNFGIHIAYHYHAGTGVFLQSEIDYLLENTSPQLITLLLDTGHAALADIDPFSLWKKYSHRIKYIHLKDIREDIFSTMKKTGLNFMDAVRAGIFTVPGDGMIDFKPLLKTLYQKNYNGWIMIEAEQDPAKAPPKLYAEKAINFIKSLQFDD